jgi:hypothetical protein
MKNKLNKENEWLSFLQDKNTKIKPSNAKQVPRITNTKQRRAVNGE